MSMKKIELLRSLMDRVPIAGHRAIDWLERMGIDDDTTAEELDRYETLLYGIKQQRLTVVLFAVLDTLGVPNLDWFEKIVDEVHAGRWIVDDDIRSVYQLHYFIKHDYEEKPTPDMSRDDLLCGDDEPTLGRQMLEKQSLRGGLSHFGWVHYSEA